MYNHVGSFCQLRCKYASWNSHYRLPIKPPPRTIYDNKIISFLLLLFFLQELGGGCQVAGDLVTSMSSLWLQLIAIIFCALLLQHLEIRVIFTSGCTRIYVCSITHHGTQFESQMTIQLYIPTFFDKFQGEKIRIFVLRNLKICRRILYDVFFFLSEIMMQEGHVMYFNESKYGEYSMSDERQNREFISYTSDQKVQR